MDKDTKRLLGKLLGEVFLIQGALKDKGIKCQASKQQIYGLLHGFEDSVDEVLEQLGEISSTKLEAVITILKTLEDEEKLQEFKGFYDIKDELEQQGVNRAETIIILKYLANGDQFNEVIKKIADGAKKGGSGGSPIEFASLSPAVQWANML